MFISVSRYPLSAPHGHEQSGFSGIPSLTKIKDDPTPERPIVRLAMMKALNATSS